MFARFCIDSSSILCGCLLVSLLIFFLCSVRVVSVSFHEFTGSSTSPLCASVFVHPQVVPLIVSSHLLNVRFIVSWLNIIICNRKCKVIDNTNTISKLHLEKLLSVFCRFFLKFCRFSVDSLSSCVDVCLTFCRLFDHIMFVLSRVFTGSSISPLCASEFVHPQVVPLIVSSHLLYHDGI